MKPRILLATVMVILGVANTTLLKAAPPGSPSRYLGRNLCCSLGLISGCPDDYCRKSFPHIWCLGCGQPDDYCRKPFPHIWCLPCGGPDDYCRKPWPDLCRPLCPDYYTCGRPNCSAPTSPPTHAPAIMNGQDVKAADHNNPRGTLIPYHPR